jgi:hypothetical protein
MKKRFSEEQIIGFLKEAEAGLPVKELCGRAVVSAWRRDYNEARPHSALNYQSPAEFAAKHPAPVGAPVLQEHV